MIEGIDTEKLTEHAKELEELFNKKILLCTNLEKLTDNRFSGNITVIKNQFHMTYDLCFRYILNGRQIEFQETLTQYEIYSHALERFAEHLTQSIKEMIVRDLFTGENRKMLEQSSKI